MRKVVSNPRELPNIPRDDKVIKRAFVPKLGAFSFFDFKQIEPRLTAYFAAKIGFPEFAEQLVAGVDPYTAVARLATGQVDITEQERQVWKRVFLAILYGAGARRVREVWIEETKHVITEAHAKKIVRTFHDNWPAVRALQDTVIRTHQRRGYIRGLDGRHLHMEEFGEHKLLNKLIQGSAAGIMKDAVVRVDEWLSAGHIVPISPGNPFVTRRHLSSHMVSVIHDELVFDGPEAELSVLHDYVPALMDVVPEVSAIVPILVDHEVSMTSWAEKQAYEEWATTEEVTA